MSRLGVFVTLVLLLALYVYPAPCSAGMVPAVRDLVVERLERLLPEGVRQIFSSPRSTRRDRPEVHVKCGSGVDPDGKPCPAPVPPCETCG
jgi:hypothetical protein